MKRLWLKQLQRVAEERPPGYLNECLSRGTVEDGWLNLSDDDYDDIRNKYNPRGVGDTVAHLARPIAKAIGLEGCGGCKERQEWLNRQFPS